MTGLLRTRHNLLMDALCPWAIPQAVSFSSLFYLYYSMVYFGYMGLLDKGPKGPRRRVTKNKIVFAKKFIENGGNATDAFLKMRAEVGSPFYTPKNHVARVGGFHMLQDPIVRQLIAKAEDKIYEQAIPTIEKLKQLRDAAEGENVQLGASSQLMDAFFKVVKRMDEKEEKLPENLTQNVIITNMTTDEILARIAKFTVGAKQEGRAGDALSGAGAPEVQGVSDVSDGGVPGVQEPSADTQGS